MEVVFAKKLDSNFLPVTTLYGDVIDLMRLNINVEGIEYDDNYSVMRFLGGRKIKDNALVQEITKTIDFTDDFFSTKIKDLSHRDFKYALLLYVLLKHKEVIILDHFEIGLNYAEQKKLIRLIKSLAKEGNKFIIVSNNWLFLSQISDKVTIINEESILTKEYNQELWDSICGDEPEIIRMINMANRLGANLQYTLDSKELLKDIYRSIR